MGLALTGTMFHRYRNTPIWWILRSHKVCMGVSNFLEWDQLCVDPSTSKGLRARFSKASRVPFYDCYFLSSFSQTHIDIYRLHCSWTQAGQPDSISGEHAWSRNSVRTLHEHLFQWLEGHYGQNCGPLCEHRCWVFKVHELAPAEILGDWRVATFKYRVLYRARDEAIPREGQIHGEYQEVNE